MVKVKICGITNIGDAMAAVDAGADALGFVLADSPRHIDAQAVARIVEKLPPFISTVGVFANQDFGEINALMARACLQFAQVHGDTTCPKDPCEYSQGCRKLIRALRIRSAADIQSASVQCDCAAYLLDAHVDGVMGGTGRTFDWDLAVQARSLNKPIILAGGLNSANVEEAIQKVYPYAVDVSTGVEASPGKKDHRKIKEFIVNVRKSA